MKGEGYVEVGDGLEGDDSEDESMSASTRASISTLSLFSVSFAVMSSRSLVKLLVYTRSART